MATFSEVEDLRDWFIDTCAEMQAKVELLNGDEPADVLETIGQYADILHTNACEIIGLLDKLLILKKKDEYEED